MSQDPAAWADAAIAELDKRAASAPPKDEFGDEAWADAAMSQLDWNAANPPTLMQSIGTGFQGLSAGLLEGGKAIFSDVPKAAALGIAGTLADALGKERPGPESIRPDSPAAIIGRGADTAIQALTPATAREQQSLAFEGQRMVGSIIPLLTAALGGPELAAGIGGAQQAGQSGMEAVQGGADPEHVIGAMALGSSLGMAGGAGGGQILERIAARSGGKLEQALTGIAANAAEGAGAGVAYTAAANAIHNWATDDEIPLLLNADTNGLFGAALGGFIRSAAESAMALREKTGRRYTAEGGWEGNLLPEDAAVPQPQEGHPLTEAAGRTEAHAQAEAEGARIREESAHLYPEPAKSTESGKPAAVRPRDVMEVPPEARDIGEPIYDPVTGAYVGNAEVPPTVAKPLGDQRRAPARQRDVMSLPEEYQGSIDKPVWDPVRGEYRTPGEPTPDVNRARPRSVEQYQGHREPGIGDYGDEYTPRGKVQPTPTRQPYAPEGPEPGIAYAPDESVPMGGARFQAGNAPVPLAPQIDLKAADLHPVVDAKGRTVVNIGDRLRGTIEDTGGFPQIQRRQEVVDAVVAAGRTLMPEAGLRMGYVPKGAVGLYGPQTRTLRIARHGDMSTAAHEVGHAIENRILGTTDSPFMESARRDALTKELTGLGRIANPDSIPPNGLLSEGWAEFVRMWLMQHEDLMHFAPETTRWFDGAFLKQNPEFAAHMDVAQAKADMWRFQGSEKRTLGSIAQPKSLREKVAAFSVKETARKLNRLFFSSFEAAKRFEDAKAAMGKPSAPERRVDNLITAFAGKAEQQAEHFVTNDTTDLWGNKTGEGLASASAAMRGKQADLEAYGKSKRTIWLRTEREAFNPKTGEYELAPHDNGQTLEDAMVTVAKLEAKYPHIEDTMQRVQQWWERVLDYVVAADPLFAHVREAMRQEGEFYIPQKREFEPGASVRRTGTKAGARAGKMGEKLSEGGSGRPTIPFLKQMQLDAAELMRRAHERMVLDALVKNGREAGLGFLVEDVTDTLHGTGEGYTIGSEVPPQEVGAAALDSFFSVPNVDASGRAVFKYTELAPDGRARTRAIAVHPDLYDAIVSLNPNDLRTGLGWVGTVARATRQGVIGGAVIVNPAWTFFKNVAYDPQTAFLNTRYSGAFRDLVLDWIPNMVRVAAHEYTGGRLNYPWVDTYRRMGANVSAPFQSERRVQGRTQDIGAKPVRRVLTLANPQNFYDMLARFMGISEEAPRVWELKRAAKQVGWKPGEPITPKQYIEMSIATRRITGNRAEAGTATNTINQYVPFFRSALVQPRDTFRAATAEGNRLSFAIKAASLAGLAAIYWKMYGKDKRVQSQDANERMGYLTFPLPTNEEGREDSVRIPIAPEAAFFMAPTMFALDALDGEDAYKGSEIAQAYWDTYSPPFIPAVASEPTLQFANRFSFHGQAPIVPEGQQKLPAPEQVGPQTSQLAVWLGKRTGLSPRRIEHAVGGVWGAPGEFALNGLGLLPDPKNQKQTVRDVLEGTWIRRGGSTSKRSRWVNQMFTLAEVAESDYASKESEWTPDKQIIREALRDTAKAVSTAYAIADTYALTAKDRQELYTLANNLAYQTVHAVNGKPDAGAALNARLNAYVEHELLSTRKQTLDLIHQGPPKAWRTP